MSSLSEAGQKKIEGTSCVKVKKEMKVEKEMRHTSQNCCNRYILDLFSFSTFFWTFSHLFSDPFLTFLYLYQELGNRPNSSVNIPLVIVIVVVGCRVCHRHRHHHHGRQGLDWILLYKSGPPLVPSASHKNDKKNIFKCNLFIIMFDERYNKGQLPSNRLKIQLKRQDRKFS